MTSTMVEVDSNAAPQDEQEQVFEWLLSLLTRDGDIDIEQNTER